MDPVDALIATRAAFGPDPRKRKLDLLDRIAGAPPPGSRALKACRDTLLFIAAYPDDAAVRRAADAALRALDEAIAADDRLAGRLAGSGIPGTAVEAPFSIDLARWLVRRFPGDVGIAWEDGSAGPGVDELLAACAPPAQRDGLLTGRLTTQAWLQLAAGTEGDELAWLLGALDAAAAATPELVDLVIEKVELRLSWRVTGPPADGGFARRHVFAQKESLRRSADVKEIMSRPLPAARPLPARQARALIDTARLTLAAQSRETDPVTYANPREITRLQLERGIDIALYGMLPERRLPLESFFGYLAARNGVPVAYGGGWVFFDRCEIGINIFEAFRGGESANLFAQVLRVYRRHYNTRRFLVDPFQFGADNRDGIRSGAFWFYYRFGFRPVQPALATLAEAEWSRIRADRAYRCPASTLRRLAAGKLCLEVAPPPAGAPETPDVVELGLAVTRAAGRRCGPDAAAAERRAIRRVRRVLGRLPAPDCAIRRLAPVAALIDDLEQWPAADRRALAAVIRAKGGIRERDYVIRLQRHRRFRSALASLVGKSDEATKRRSDGGE